MTKTTLFGNLSWGEKPQNHRVKSEQRFHLCSPHNCSGSCQKDARASPAPGWQLQAREAEAQLEGETFLWWISRTGDCFPSGRACCAWEMLISSHSSPAMDGWHGRSPDPQAMALRESDLMNLGICLTCPREKPSCGWWVEQDRAYSYSWANGFLATGNLGLKQQEFCPSLVLGGVFSSALTSITHHPSICVHSLVHSQ